MPNEVELKIDRDAVFRVGAALEQGDGDLSECLAPDLKKIAALLAHIAALEDLAPGLLANILSTLIPFYIKRQNSDSIKEFMGKKATMEGLDSEWQAVLKAKDHPLKKDLIQSLVAFDMKVRGVSQAESIKACATQLQKDEDSIRRVVTRSKKRKR